MTFEFLACPQCQAPLSLTPGRRFYQCAYCGSKFAVELPDGQSPRLTRFESMLGALASKPPLPDAQQRLADLELTVADAEDAVDGKQAELNGVKDAYWQTRIDLQRLISPLQNSTYVAGLLSALAVFSTLFVFRRPERLPGVAAAVLLAATGWAFHREWQETEVQGQDEVEEAKAAITEAEGELRSALGRLEDQTLERELWQRQIIAAGGHGEASSA